jgi:hypothetical protein
MEVRHEGNLCRHKAPFPAGAFFGCHAFERNPRESCVWMTTNPAFSALGAPMTRVGSTRAPCLGLGIAKIRESCNLNLNKVGIWWRSD